MASGVSGRLQPVEVSALEGVRRKSREVGMWPAREKPVSEKTPVYRELDLAGEK
jgi:hypothetical protein